MLIGPYQYQIEAIGIANFGVLDRDNIEVVAFCSNTAQATPFVPSSIASAKPVGPPPIITTGKSIAVLGCEAMENRCCY